MPKFGGTHEHMRLVRHMHSVGMLALVAGMPLTYTVRDCGTRRGTLYDTGFLPSTLQTAWDKYSGAFWGRWTQSIGSSRLVRPVLAPLLDRRVPPPPTRVTSHESHLATVKLASVGVGRGGAVALRVRVRARTCNHNLFVMPLQDRPASSGCLVASLGLPIDERWISPLSKDRPAAVAVCGRH